MAKKMVDECDSDDDMDDVSMVFSVTILIDNVIYRPLFVILCYSSSSCIWFCYLHFSPLLISLWI